MQVHYEWSVCCLHYVVNNRPYSVGVYAYCGCTCWISLLLFFPWFRFVLYVVTSSFLFPFGTPRLPLLSFVLLCALALSLSISLAPYLSLYLTLSKNSTHSFSTAPVSDFHPLYLGPPSPHGRYSFCLQCDCLIIFSCIEHKYENDMVVDVKYSTNISRSLNERNTCKARRVLWMQHNNRN